LSDNCKIEYNLKFNEAYNKDFSRDKIQNRIDDVLMGNDKKEIMEYIISPKKLFEKYFEIEWKSFQSRVDPLIMDLIKDLSKSIQQVSDFIDSVKT